MTILIYCPDSKARESICHHLIDMGKFQLLIAETEPLTVSLALHNPIDLVLLFDPSRTPGMKCLREFLNAKKSTLKVLLLPSKYAALSTAWRRTVNAALKPRRERGPRAPKTHPRFHWKPNG